MILKIQKVQTGSVCRIFGTLQAGIGLVTGVFFTLAVFIDPEFVQGSAGGMASFFGVWSFIVMPVLGGALGLLAGAVTAWAYNTYVHFSGTGLTVEVEEVR